MKIERSSLFVVAVVATLVASVFQASGASQIDAFESRANQATKIDPEAPIEATADPTQLTSTDQPRECLGGGLRWRLEIPWPPEPISRWENSTPHLGGSGQAAHVGQCT